MQEHFVLENRNKEIVGYGFPCESPSHVMCVIHGIGEHAGRYKRMAEILGHQGIATVSMDLRGHGISKGTRGDAAPRREVLKDVDALIDYARKTYPELPITLYGHSMGGNICLDYMLRGNYNDIPVKYIVSAPWIRLVRPVAKPLYITLKCVSKVMPKMTISSACEEENLGNLDYVKPYKADPLVHDKISARCAVEGFDIGEAIATGTHENNHKADHTPLLIMHGDADKICDINGTRDVACRLKDRQNFTYKEWPGYYHEIHNGGPEATGNQVIEKIIEFVLE